MSGRGPMGRVAVHRTKSFQCEEERRDCGEEREGGRERMSEERVCVAEQRDCRGTWDTD